MILFLISFFLLLFFFLFLSKSLPLKAPLPVPPWAKEMRMLSILFVQELAQFILQQLEGFRSVTVKRRRFHLSSNNNKCWMANNTQRLGITNKSYSTVLDLPELALDYILGKLSPAELSKMACVCHSMRDKCESDYLWERHMTEKWGRLMGRAARREWDYWYMTSRQDSSINFNRNFKPTGWMSFMSCVFPPSWFCPEIDAAFNPRIGSIKSWYQSLESGRLWFPAQVYNRENGHVGFMLSCYDAELSYDCRTDTFHARYPPHGQRAINIEEGVHWDRLRAPAADTPAHDLHVSDCLNDLRPGDHVEIQWRKDKEFPYGWWYGVVGHLDSCDGNGHHCVCHNSVTIILEFNHYNPGSRWRRTIISRADHKEQGNETDGFYGGIRKLHRKDEISTWKRLWPNAVLE